MFLLIRKSYLKVTDLNFYCSIFYERRDFFLKNNRKKIANILGIVTQQQETIDENKFRELRSRKNVWDHFGLDREDFLNHSEEKQLRLTAKFYFKNILSRSKDAIDSSIGTAIQNSNGINIKKVFENGNDRTGMSLSTVPQSEEKKPKSVPMWKNNGFFLDECCDFSIEKVNMPKNTLFYENQGYQSYKDNKKVCYNDVFIIAQIMPLAHQPKDIESYELKNNEVEMLRPKYDPNNGQFLVIEYCVALITVKNDLDEQFFDYGYNKENSKLLYSIQKVKIPSSFKATCFGTYKNQYEDGVFSEEDFSRLFFYLSSTIDRSEEINKYLTSVYLKPYHLPISDLGKDFNPALSFDRAAVVSHMKKVANKALRILKEMQMYFYQVLNMTTIRLSGQEARGQYQINFLQLINLFVIYLRSCKYFLCE